MHYRTKRKRRCSFSDVMCWIALAVCGVAIVLIPAIRMLLGV